MQTSQISIIYKKGKRHKKISQEKCIDTRIVPRQQTFGQSSGQYCFRATMEEAIDILGPIVSRRTSGRVYLAVSLEVTYQVEQITRGGEKVRRKKRERERGREQVDVQHVFIVATQGNNGECLSPRTVAVASLGNDDRVAGKRTPQCSSKQLVNE